MTRVVDFYSVEVRYSGSFEDYTERDLYDMALVKQAQRGDFTPDYTEEMTEEKARDLDGNIEVVNAYPCNKIAIVKYSYIRETNEEEG